MFLDDLAADAGFGRGKILFDLDNFGMMGKAGLLGWCRAGRGDGALLVFYLKAGAGEKEAETY